MIIVKYYIKKVISNKKYLSLSSRTYTWWIFRGNKETGQEQKLYGPYFTKDEAKLSLADFIL